MTPQLLRERLDNLGLALLRHKRMWIVGKHYPGAFAVRGTFPDLPSIVSWLRTYQ